MSAQSRLILMGGGDLVSLAKVAVQTGMICACRRAVGPAIGCPGSLEWLWLQVPGRHPICG
jgi:hypothetical protein